MMKLGFMSMDRVLPLIWGKCVVRFNETIDEKLWSEINLRENDEFGVVGIRFDPLFWPAGQVEAGGCFFLLGLHPKTL